VLQFYDADEKPLFRNVGRFLYEGWKHGETLIVIGTSQHIARFSEELASIGADADTALRQDKLIFLDARQMLAQFMCGGQPDAERFRATIGPLLARAGSSAGSKGVRAYGEMVNVLWKEGNLGGAIQLERLWNDLLRDFEFILFCAYQIDIFDGGIPMTDLNPILCSHTHLLPTAGADLEGAITGAMREIIGFRSEIVSNQIKSYYRPSWASMPASEAIIFWLKNNLPDQAQAILERARQTVPATC